jgi:PhzF family phenazine biosynthesis protein
VPHPLYQVNAFTATPFAGNPAAVCLLPGPADAGWMQLVARDLNLSETAFLAPEADGHRLRWFTPAVEVDLCGHATLASAFVLWHAARLAPDQPARFHTRSGLLTAARRGDQIVLDFPAVHAQPTDPPPGLSEALGARALTVGRNRMDYLVEVATEEELRGLRPDFGRLAAAPARGVIVTSRSARPEFDFVSRFFAPAAGVNEDPVTGSAHCCLAPFWGARLHKEKMVGYQASARGGVVRVEVAGERVLLGGAAVLVWRGELVV